MQRFENDCVDCVLPCIGSTCPYRHVLHVYCDECGEEIGPDVYSVDGKDLCEECLKNMFRCNGEIIYNGDY